MAIHIVRLGSDRLPDEGVRIGTVRRPPRGVPRTEFARQNWYDVWYPNLAPSADTMKLGQAVQDDAQWRAFAKRYQAEMRESDAAHSIELLARMSHGVNFSVGCYCQLESRCHRSLLRGLLADQGALIAG